MRIDPEGPAGERIERDQIVGRRHSVHHSIHDQRGGFELFGGASTGPDLIDPLQLEIGNVGGRNPCERGMPPTIVTARVHEPVPGLLGGFEQAFGGDLAVREV